MDPPLPPHPPTNTTVIAAQPGYPDPNDSSPHSRQPDTWDESLPQVPGAKLRIMCSFGGHIIPRPHDKSLCYVGGETRMVVIDRQSSLSSLATRLSHSLLNGRHFTLKYQLPNEELDSLVSVSTDEDLENMVEEYDRIVSSSPLKPSRLRIFLFMVKPETAASMGSLFNDAKSETWFVDALNGSGLLPRGLSDSAIGDFQLVQLDNGAAQTDLKTKQTDFLNNTNTTDNNKHLKSFQELQSTMPDLPLVETGSSFGSSSSSPSMSNLPAIKVRMDNSGITLQNQMAGLDEQFSHIDISASAQKPDDGSMLLLTPDSVVNDTIVSDDDRSDHGAATSFRKPPLPLHLVPRKVVDGYNLPSPNSKNVGGLSFPSPDSVASDSSTGSAFSLPKHAVQQEPTQTQVSEYRPATPPVVASVAMAQDTNSQVQFQQVNEHTYLTPPQQIQQQQQYIQPHIQYIHHHPTTGQAPISSYYPMYAPPPQQQLHHQVDQRYYPTYISPVSHQNQAHQPYNHPSYANIADSSVMASSRPSSNLTQNKNVATQTFYTTNMPEMGRNVYTTPAKDFQQQYVPIQTNNPALGENYGYEYSHPTNEQVYYTQHPAGQLPLQHQTLTAATAMIFQQASAQLPKENSDQQVRISQPL